MSRNQIIIGALIMCSMSMFPYLNCSQSGFDNQVNFESNVGTPLGPDEEEAIRQRLGDELQQPPRPITDLEDDPTLYELYKCIGSDGVVICHFPDSVDGRTTQCVGRPAVRTHYDHIREYVVSGETKSIQDYLGPCRDTL